MSALRRFISEEYLAEPLFHADLLVIEHCNYHGIAVKASLILPYALYPIKIGNVLIGGTIADAIQESALPQAAHPCGSLPVAGMFLHSVRCRSAASVTSPLRE